MSVNELDRFPAMWEAETANTLKLLNALRVNQYDFSTRCRRPFAWGAGLAPGRDRWLQFVLHRNGEIRCQHEGAPPGTTTQG